MSIRPKAGVEALFAPRRYLLDRLLVNATQEAGVDVRHETTVTALRRDERGRVRGVHAVGRGGRAVELSTSVSVGADGVRSTVAGLVRAPVVRQGRSSSAVLYRYVSGLLADGYEWAYGDGATAGLIPTNDGDTCVFVSTTRQRMGALRRRAPSTRSPRSSPEQLPRCSTGWALQRQQVGCAAGAMCPVTSAGPGGRDEPWSGTPAGRIREAHR